MDLKVQLTGARCVTCGVACISTETKRVNLFIMMHAIHEVVFVGVVVSPPEMEGVTIDLEPIFREVQK